METDANHISIIPPSDPEPGPITPADMAEMIERGATPDDVAIACANWGCDLPRLDRTTHARLSVNEDGEVEARSLDVVQETTPEGPHSLMSLDFTDLIQSLCDSESGDERPPAA